MQAEPLLPVSDAIKEFISFIALFLSAGPLGFRYFALRSRDSASDRPFYDDAAKRAAAIGLIGVGVAPTAAPWFWAALIGFGQGSAFALALVLLVRFAATPHASGGLSAMGFLIGYGVASVGPLAMGALRDATGAFEAVWIVLAALMLPQLVICVVLRPRLPKVGAP